MGLAEPDITIDKERVIFTREVVGYGHTGGVGEFVGLTDDKFIKDIFGIKPDP